MQAVDAARAAAADVNFFQSAAWPAEAADGPWRPQQQQQQQQQQQPVAVGRLVCFASIDAFFLPCIVARRSLLSCVQLLAAEMVVVPEILSGTTTTSSSPIIIYNEGQFFAASEGA